MSRTTGVVCHVQQVSCVTCHRCRMSRATGVECHVQQVSCVTCHRCRVSRATGVVCHVPQVSCVTCHRCRVSRATGVVCHVPQVDVFRMFALDLRCFICWFFYKICRIFSCISSGLVWVDSLGTDIPRIFSSPGRLPLPKNCLCYFMNLGVRP